MPALGLGVFQSPPEETTAAVETALRDGYRLIDTAAAYDNEREVGEGIRRSGVTAARSSSSTKLWISDYGYDAAHRLRRRACAARPRPRRPLSCCTSRCRPTSRHDRRLQGRRDVARRRHGARAIGVFNFSRSISRDPDRPHRRRAGGQPGRAAPVLHAARSAEPSTPSSGIVTQAWSPTRRRSRLHARHRRRGPQPADRPGHHRPRSQVRQDPGAGRAALAHRARLLRDPEVRQAAPHRRELRRLRLLAHRRRGRRDRRARHGERGGPDPEPLSPETYPKVVDNS